MANLCIRNGGARHKNDSATKQRNREFGHGKNRQTDRQTEKQRDRQTNYCTLAVHAPRGIASKALHNEAEMDTAKYPRKTSEMNTLSAESSVLMPRAMRGRHRTCGSYRDQRYSLLRGVHHIYGAVKRTKFRNQT